MGIVIEEVDETLFWLEIIQTKCWSDSSYIETIIKEADELTAIFVSSLKTVKSRMSNPKS